MSVDPLRIQAAIARLYADANLPRPSAPGIVSVKALLRRLPGQVQVHELTGFTHGEAADYLLSKWAINPPVDRTDDRRIAGLVYAVHTSHAYIAHVFARAEDPVTRRRFTIGHELGHIYLHFLPTAGVDAFLEVYEHGEVRPPSPDAETPAPYSATDAFGTFDDDALPDYDTMEAEANAFSAALLMPEAACHAHAQALVGTYGDRRAVLARRMAPDFLVSKTAMRNRLRTLGIGVEPE